MKTTLLLAAATAALLTAVSIASAHEPVLTPRAKASQTQVMPCCATASDVNLVANRPMGNAKAWALAKSLRTVPSTGPSVDLAHGPRPLLSAKDPRFETALRELRGTSFQVAPLK